LTDCLVLDKYARFLNTYIYIKYEFVTKSVTYSNYFFKEFKFFYNKILGLANQCP